MNNKQNCKPNYFQLFYVFIILFNVILLFTHVYYVSIKNVSPFSSFHVLVFQLHDYGKNANVLKLILIVKVVIES